MSVHPSFPPSSSEMGEPPGPGGPGPRPIVALGFSPEAKALLLRLESSGLFGSIRWPGAAPSPADWLQQHWDQAEAVVAVGACGLIVRLIAPLLEHKQRDPAVVVLDPAGRFAIPLLGGHFGGGEALAARLAALLGAEVVPTGSSSAMGRLPLDAFGRAWGWSRGGGDWNALMQAASRSGALPPLEQTCGLELWRNLTALDGAGTGAVEDGADLPGPALVIGPAAGPGCRWHPPCLWLGMGCERDTSLVVLERLVERTLALAGLAPEAVAGLASIDRKGDEAALLALSQRHGWPLRLFDADTLAAVSVPNPSEAVAETMGTASVAEAAALRAAGAAAADAAAAMAISEGNAGVTRAPAAELVVPKTIERAAHGERGAATLAVALAGRQWAPQRGELHLVGSGPGQLDLLSGDARSALALASVWVGYGPYLDLLEPLRRPDQLRRDGRLTEERARCAEALDLATQGLRVALVSSGDSGIYGMAGLALEQWLARDPIDRPAFQVHPGISALQLAAARAGAPLMHDFCTISLSDRLTPWEVIERRLRAAAAGDFVVALYNPRSLGRDWQLERARTLLLEGRPAGTPVALARQLGRQGETVQLHTLVDLPVEEVDMLTLVLIGNSTSRVQDGRMVTPRGYPGASLG
jgi:cobalt-precorrin 5A hydrolase / precorrin-3B C17-methyltransferase